MLWESFRTLDLHPKIAPVIEMDRDIRGDFLEWYNNQDPPKSSWVLRRRAKMPSEMPSEWIIGRKFGVRVDGDYPAETLDDYDDIYRRWGAYSHEPIHWLTKPVEPELQLVYTAVSSISKFLSLAVD